MSATVVQQSAGDRREELSSPPPYRPTQPTASFFQRCLWRLSPLGRARLSLWTAHREPDSPVTRTSLEHALAKLSRAAVKNNPDNKPLVQEIQLFLVSSALQQKRFADAANWLTELDRGFPTSLERLALRWDLLDRLRLGKATADYVTQVKAFLADPMLTRYAGALLHTMQVVYETLPLHKRAELVSSIYPPLVEDRRVREALVLWQCPERFTTQEEARGWAGQVTPANLSFAPAMQVDALLVAARAAEWESDWAGMEAKAHEALRVLPNHLQALVCLTHARLHQSGSALPEELKLEQLPDAPIWQRLRLQCQLHRQPVLQNVGPLLPMLAGELGGVDSLELGLTLKLLERALSSDSTRQRANLQQCAELSVRIESLAANFASKLPFHKCLCAHCASTVEFPAELDGKLVPCPHCAAATKLSVPKNASALLPWAEINLALKEIQIDQQYAAAFTRLEKKELTDFLAAPQLAQVARFLAGSPKPPDEHTHSEDCLSVLALALWVVLDHAATAVDPTTLLRRLESVRNDPILQQFPPLLSCLDVLSFALRVLNGEVELRESILEYEMSPEAPTWSTWLRSRLAQIVSDYSVGERLVTRTTVKDPATAWFVECWWHNYGPAIPSLPTSIIEIRKLLDSGLPSECQSLCDAIRAARTQRVHIANFNAELAGAQNVFSTLGDLGSSVCIEELNLELELLCARSCLTKGDTQIVVSRLNHLRESLSKLSLLSSRWWKPLIDYWLGVALARNGDAEASAVIAGLLEGPKAVEARAQLAMLALQKRDLVAAESWLTDLPRAFPSVCYAQALLHSRLGSRQKADEILHSFDSRFGKLPSQYRLAAVRLRAALAERAGDGSEAERLHQETLRDYPNDPITIARLSRLRLRGAYPPSAQDGIAEIANIAELVQRTMTGNDPAVSWATPLQLLCRLLTCPLDEANATHSEADALCRDSRTRAALAQVLAWRLIAGHPQEVLAVLERCGSGPLPSWHRRSVMLLRAWNYLSRIWSPPKRPTQGEIAAEAKRLWLENGKQPGRDDENWKSAEKSVRAKGLAVSISHATLAQIPTHLQEMNSFQPAQPDPAFEQWRILLSLAKDLAARGEEFARQDGWQNLTLKPLAHLPELWSPEPIARRQAAEKILSQLGGASSNSETNAPRLLRSLATWTLGDEDAFLEDFNALEANLERWPVEAPILWQAAAGIWLRRRNWKKLLADDLPECVADLSHPGVRFIIGLAYAQAATESLSKGDARSALQKVRQARGTLEQLVQNNSETSNKKGS